MNILGRNLCFSTTKLLKHIRQTGTKLYEPDYLEVVHHLTQFSFLN